MSQTGTVSTLTYVASTWIGLLCITASAMRSTFRTMRRHYSINSNVLVPRPTSRPKCIYKCCASEVELIEPVPVSRPGGRAGISSVIISKFKPQCLNDEQRADLQHDIVATLVLPYAILDSTTRTLWATDCGILLSLSVICVRFTPCGARILVLNTSSTICMFLKKIQRGILTNYALRRRFMVKMCTQRFDIDNSTFNLSSPATDY